MENNPTFINYKMSRINEDEVECLYKLGDIQHTTSFKKVDNRTFESNYKTVKLDEDELECLRKLGDIQHTTSYKKVDTASTFASNYYNTVKLDEDELECLHKLEEHSSSTHKRVTTNNYKMASIDEDDEVQSLGKSEENITTTTINKSSSTRKMVVDRPYYNKRSSSNNNNKVEVRAEKRDCQMAITNKLESKKSEDINESAEKFIQSFKQQLLLQRLESIENVDQMLARGL